MKYGNTERRGRRKNEIKKRKSRKRLKKKVTENIYKKSSVEEEEVGKAKVNAEYSLVGG